jgi:hypothetical protein
MYTRVFLTLEPLGLEVGAMNNSIQNCIADRRVSNEFMPAAHRNLAGHQQRSLLVRGGAETAFPRYTVSSYVTNFDSYNGRRFQVSPAARAIRDGEVVVQSRLLRIDGSSIALDYIMLRGSAGWQAVDVLTGGSLSRAFSQTPDRRWRSSPGGRPRPQNRRSLRRR